MVSTIAVGTDGSATAGEAVKMAGALAKQFDAKLVLLSAFKDLGGPADGESIELQWATNKAARVREILSRAEDHMRRDGIDCTTQVEEGDAANVLVQLATECSADLLVIGNKGMQRRVLGSVPNKAALTPQRGVNGPPARFAAGRRRAGVLSSVPRASSSSTSGSGSTSSGLCRCSR